MHNWSLLLLAFLGAFQPITSFTERSLVDGRQECSDHRGLWDSRLSIYGTIRHNKLADERRVNYLESRETHRYEARDGNSLFATSERRVVDLRDREEVRGSPERSIRLARVQYRRTRDNRDSFYNGLARRSVDDWRTSLRDNDRRQRNRVVTREPLARESRDTRRHHKRQQREHSFERLSPVERRSVRNDYQRSQFSLDARHDSRRNGNFLRESQRAPKSRNELHRTRIEVARMEPARNSEETRVSMGRARQMGREVSSRSDARLQHRERAVGRLARDESAKRSPPLNTRNSNDRTRNMHKTSTASRNEIRKLGEETEMARRGNSHTSFAVYPSRETRDVSVERRVARERTDRSTELRSRDLSRSRTSEVQSSELRSKRDLKRLSTERDYTLQRSRDLARSRSLETRFTELRRSRDLGNLERRTTEQSNELRSRSTRSKDKESSSIEISTELYRSRDAGSRNFDRRSERSAEPRISRDFSRSRNLEPSSFRAELATEERRETRRSYVRGYDRVQNREERRLSDLSRQTNERQSRRVNFGSERSAQLASQRNEDREERRTVSESRRVESRRLTDRESTRNRESRSLNRVSVQSRNTRYIVKDSNIKNVIHKRDTVTSRTRANVDANGNRNAWNFAQEKPQIGTQKNTMQWQYLLYTVQAIYLVSFLVQLFGEKYTSEKKIRSHGFCATAQKLLKLE